MPARDAGFGRPRDASDAGVRAAEGAREAVDVGIERLQTHGDELRPAARGDGVRGPRDDQTPHRVENEERLARRREQGRDLRPAQQALEVRGVAGVGSQVVLRGDGKDDDPAADGRRRAAARRHPRLVLGLVPGRARARGPPEPVLDAVEVAADDHVRQRRRRQRSTDLDHRAGLRPRLPVARRAAAEAEDEQERQRHAQERLGGLDALQPRGPLPRAVRRADERGDDGHEQHPGERVPDVVRRAASVAEDDAEPRGWAVRLLLRRLGPQVL